MNKNKIKMEVTVKETGEDLTNPNYYQRGGLQAIDVIEYFLLPFHLGNTVKYLLRAGHKTEDGTLDLKKGLWYLNRFLGARIPHPKLIIDGMKPSKEQVEFMTEVVQAFNLNYEVREIVRIIVGVVFEEEKLKLTDAKERLELYIEKYELTRNG